MSDQFEPAYRTLVVTLRQAGNLLFEWVAAVEKFGHPGAGDPTVGRAIELDIQRDQAVAAWQAAIAAIAEDVE